MVGTCIISLDCEGKWGMADRLNSDHEKLFSEENLIAAYESILATLAQKNLKATFAFVGAFTLEKSYFTQAWLSPLSKSAQHRKWLHRLMSDLEKGTEEGWFLPQALRMVLNSDAKHEAASHGFTHLPFDTASESSVELEIAGILDWMNVHGLKIDTFIFPRNQVSRNFDLSRLGITGYRDRPAKRGFLGVDSRLFNLLYEFYPFTPSQPLIDCAQPGMIAIPGDFFLNWRHGLRRYVPANLTVYRFRHALRHAARNNGVVHLWFHPHNLLTGSRQQALFERCVKALGEEADAGAIIVKTQAEFVSPILGAG